VIRVGCNQPPGLCVEQPVTAVSRRRCCRAAVFRTVSTVVAASTVVGCASHGSASSAAGGSGGLTNAQRALAVRVSETEGWGSRPSDPGLYPPGVDPSAPGSWPTDIESASVILTTHADAMQYVGGGTEAGDGSRAVLVIRLVGHFSWITTGPPGHGPATGNVATIVVDATTGQGTDTGLESVNSPVSLPGATLLYKTSAVSSPIVASSPAGQVVAVSTPPSLVVGPACSAGQLTAELEDIEFAADQTFGWIIIRNTSATDCQLVGHIGLVGLDSTGTPDTVTVSAPAAGGLLLTAHAAPVPENKVPPAGEHVAFLVPDSSLSTTIGPNPGADCTATDQVIPATFRLDINGTGTVVVANTADGYPEQFRQLRVCQGQITAGTVTGEPN
jgi:hypothetical protein